MKTLWIVGGGIEAVPGIRRAKEMGLFVVVSDLDANAPGFKFADERVLASTYDWAATVQAARKFKKSGCSIDGVICIAADVPLTVAQMAAEFSLPGPSIETARLSADKLAMKQHFARAGIPIPWFSAIDSVVDLKAIVKEKDFPLVIKPVDSRGARGVLRLISGIDLNWAFECSKTASPTSRVMVEEYLPGPQVSTESVLLDGVGVTPGFSDRNYEYLDRFAPYIIENGGEQPSSLSAGDQAALKELAEEAARAMGIYTGTAKGDLVLTEQGPKVIEMAARLSGGWFCTDQISLATGVDLLGVAIRIALGEEVGQRAFRPHLRQGVGIRYFFPRPGRISAIKNTDKFTDFAWVHKLHFFVGKGEQVEPVTDHTRRTGFVLTSGETRLQAVERAKLVVDTISIQTEPLQNSETAESLSHFPS